jgi:hypothetical protein
MKSKTPNKPPDQPEKKSGASGILLVLGALILMLGIVWVTLQFNRRPAPVATVPEQPSMVATLAPELFVGKAREAYQAAKEIPEILKYLPCFCGCFGQGHRNNLYCFHDGHGEICDECQEIALIGKRMHGEGATIEKIVEAVRDRYLPRN